MTKLSVTIICYNEAENIRDCLESVKWADEIVVLDSHSTDGTVEICKEYGAKIFFREFIGFGELKNLVLDMASYDWILNLDADERVTPELRMEIERELANPKTDAYRIPRKTHFLGHWIRYCGWYPDYKENVQLFNKKKGRYTEEVHPHVEIKGRKGHFKGHIHHYPFRNLDHFLQKHERYSTLVAEQMKKDGRRFAPHQLVTHPVFMFFKMYILRRGFMQGKVGLILSTLYGYYTFLKYAKLWELTRNSAETGAPLEDKGLE